MKIYVAITNTDWINLVQTLDVSEINFWRPGTRLFNVLKPDELFLFKQHKKDGGKIIGGAYFSESLFLSPNDAWARFQEGNGTRTLRELLKRLSEISNSLGLHSAVDISCTALIKPFFFSRKQYIDSPTDWSNNLVQGKSYDCCANAIGKKLLEEVAKRLNVSIDDLNNPNKLTDQVGTWQNTENDHAEEDESVVDKHDEINEDEDGNGYVYILTNPSFREDWVKIGKTSRPVNVRSAELDNTAVPLPFEIYATFKTPLFDRAEKLIHKMIDKFTNKRIRKNREFFNIKPEDALSILRDVQDLIGGEITLGSDNSN